VENDFKPLYVVDPDKKAHIAKLKKLADASDEILLATDEDREGESIAWHLLEVLAPKVPVRRMVFHEITPAAIKAAVASPREIDRNLVDAQEARRILDRLYGYEVSPVLWKKVLPRLSAGRVQSVATRIIVDRERERMRFHSATYWDVSGKFRAALKTMPDLTPFDATLSSLKGQRIASGKDFGEDGKLTGKGDVLLLDETRAQRLADELKGGALVVTSVEQKPYKKSPAAPFMTSTLQQEAGRKLKFSTSRTMRAAQRLYEGGLITYMRTDSTTLSETAISAARSQIAQLYGKDYVPNAPRTYAKKVKNAQEAHEAIRPAGDKFRTPEEVAREVELDEARLYELIWKRTVASQMEDAQGQRVSVKLTANTASGEAVFTTSGNTITFPGFLRAYVEGSDDPNAELGEMEKILPPLKENDRIECLESAAEGHETQPPARYTEASLVRRLEELGVGRPSTYASTVGTILDRGYVWKKGTALVPSFTAFAVITLLEKHFGHLVDYAFTAKMEDDLDAIASGEARPGPWLKRFYFGTGEKGGTGGAGGVHGELGLHAMVSEELTNIDARAINTLPIGHDENGEIIVARVGRYGPYLSRGEETCSIPENMAPDELTLVKAIEMLKTPSGDVELGPDPASGKVVYLRKGRYGAYVQLGEAGEGEDKPKTASLLKSQTAEAVNLDLALQLLSLPRVVGVDPEDGKEVTATNGRYGAYLTKGTENRSLESDDQIFTVTLAEAIEILKKPKERKRRAAASSALKEFGNDPVSGKLISLRAGRFGHYVSDGETNATLKSQDDPESITTERAHELLQLRREYDAANGGAKRPKKGRRGGGGGGSKAAPKAKAKAGAKKPASKGKKKSAAGNTEQPGGNA
jgi:DNA topoisomerase-1